MQIAAGAVGSSLAVSVWFTAAAVTWRSFLPCLHPLSATKSRESIQPPSALAFTLHASDFLRKSLEPPALKEIDNES